ncbi:hypothetical protein R1sor_003670 [Riccia sorocarpa]|uniref:Phosphatidylinositol N-acetylglucosaminyltransferase subunit Y n=1 Tax=Riccia sorocarpa TaxID=122646 RepID=A0ABD3H2L7_9MARC
MEGHSINRALFRLPSLEPPRQRNPPPAYSGILFIIAGVTCICLALCITIAKVYSPAETVADNMLQSDWYYALLVPLTLPVTVVAVYFHWLSMKLFKHA